MRVQPVAGRLGLDALGLREGFEDELALEIIAGERGKQFDPQLVDVLLQQVDEVRRIQEQFGAPAPAAAPPQTHPIARAHTIHCPCPANRLIP